MEANQALVFDPIDYSKNQLRQTNLAGNWPPALTLPELSTFAGRPGQPTSVPHWPSRAIEDLTASLALQGASGLPAVSFAGQPRLHALVLATMMLATHVGSPAVAAASRVETQLTQLESRLDAIVEIGNRPVLEGPVSTFITSLSPLSYECIRDIPVTLKQVDEEEFTATFYDAGICASGDTDIEAFENLKDLIATRFEIFTARPEAELGPGPLRQLAILRTVIRTKAVD